MGGVESGRNVHTVMVGQPIRSAREAGGTFYDVIKILKGLNRRHACVVLLLTSTKKLIAAVELLGADGSDGLTVDPAMIVRHASMRAPRHRDHLFHAIVITDSTAS